MYLIPTSSLDYIVSESKYISIYFWKIKNKKNIGYCHILIETEVFQSYWVKRADGFEFWGGRFWNALASATVPGIIVLESPTELDPKKYFLDEVKL